MFLLVVTKIGAQLVEASSTQMHVYFASLSTFLHPTFSHQRIAVREGMTHHMVHDKVVEAVGPGRNSIEWTQQVWQYHVQDVVLCMW